MSSEVWAEPLSVVPEQSRATIIFTSTPQFARDPVCLSLWSWHIQSLIRGQKTPQSASDHVIHRWMSGSAQVGQVVQLARAAESGLDLFGADVPVDPRMMGPEYSHYDHNGSLMWVDLRSQVPVVRGLVGSQDVAMARLRVLFARGAKPVLGARVQANRNLYEPGPRSGYAALALFTFDPAVQPEFLEDLAEYVKHLEDEDTENPVLRAAVALVFANQEEWRYCRRARIPAELTRGHVIYIGDIWIQRAFLIDGYFSSRMPRALPLLADPGESGGLELIPHDRIDHFWPGAQGNALRPRG